MGTDSIDNMILVDKPKEPSISAEDTEHAKKLGIKFGRHVGSGTYSHVFKAEYESRSVALKVCENTGPVKHLVDQEVAVLEVLRDIPNKYVVQFIKHVLNHNSSYVWILMEWFEGIDMAEKLMANEGPFREVEARHYFRQLVEGIKYLHGLGIVHRDIKLDNILVGSDSNSSSKTSKTSSDGSEKNQFLNECIKIIDFGFAKKVELNEDDDRALCNSRIGTEVYMAPEVLNYKTLTDYDAFKSDVYSLAIVLFAFLYKCFPNDSTITTTGSLQSTSKTIKFPDSEPKVSDSAKQLISNMTLEDIHKRFNFIQILDSEWMDSQ